MVGQGCSDHLSYLFAQGGLLCHDSTMGLARRLVRLGALPILLAACSTSSSDGGGSAAAPTATAPRPGPAPTADPATPPPYNPLNDPNPPACTGNPGTIYAIDVARLVDSQPVPMCRFEGKVLLVVNTASHCGYTPEYGPLQAVYDKYRSKGFYVLGFPSQSFNQEDADASTVSAFCTSQYGITFPMFAIANVNPPDQQPLYTWLKSQPNMSADVQWNFEKFLVGRDGKVAGRFLTAVYPDDPMVTGAIEAALAKPAP